MAQLQIIQDPYAGANGDAMSSLASGFMPDPAAAAQAAKLAEDIRSARVQQEAARQKMQFDAAEEARKAKLFGQSQSAQDAEGNYWRIRVGQQLNDPNLTQQQKELIYAEQNMRDQAARLAARSAQSGKDVSESLTGFETGYQYAHPATTGSGTMPNGMPIPQMPAGLSPEAQKKWAETTGKTVSDAQFDDVASRTAAAKKLPQMVDMRDQWENVAAKGGVGGLFSQDYLRMIPRIWGTETEQAREAFDASRAVVVNQNSGDHKGEGAVSNYERELYGKPYPQVSLADAKTGRDIMKGEFSLTFRTLGVDPEHSDLLSEIITHGHVPREAVNHLVMDLQRGNMAGVQQFLDAASGK